MQNDFPLYLLLSCCFALLVKQAFVKRKLDIHYLFALFCASLCMVAIKELSASSLGPYQYLIGVATCATCNVVWLISRTLFRTTNALNRRHIIVAAVIALLIVLNQTWHLAASTGAHQWLSDVVMERLKIGLSETIGLLSSCILALTFWEAFRNYRSKNKYQKRQSIIFASAFFAAAATSMVVSKLIFSPEELATHSAWILSSCALLVVFAIQYIIYLQSQQVNAVCPEESDGVLEEQNNKAMKAGDDNSVDSTIVQGIAILMQEQRLFLQSNLKISDVAQSMSVPEYKVSKAIRCHYKAPNFNHFINQYRVDYAKTLLVDQGSAKWNILVIGLESGFSSLATFNRAFKALAGDMPSEYRKKRVSC